MYKLKCFIIIGILSVLIFAADTHSQSNKTSLYLFESNGVDTCAGQMPGDANSDGSVNLADLVFLNRFLRLGGPAPNPLSNGDFNGDCIIDTVDINALISFVLAGGPGPVDCTCLEPAVVFDCCVGIRGDVNNDGAENPNILDLNHLVNYIFRGGSSTDCPIEGDANSDGSTMNILDLNYLVNYIFRGGPVSASCI